MRTIKSWSNRKLKLSGDTKRLAPAVTPEGRVFPDDGIERIFTPTSSGDVRRDLPLTAARFAQLMYRRPPSHVQPFLAAYLLTQGSPRGLSFEGKIWEWMCDEAKRQREEGILLNDLDALLIGHATRADWILKAPKERRMSHDWQAAAKKTLGTTDKDLIKGMENKDWGGGLRDVLNKFSTWLTMAKTMRVLGNLPDESYRDLWPVVARFAGFAGDKKEGHQLLQVVWEGAGIDANPYPEAAAALMDNPGFSVEVFQQMAKALLVSLDGVLTHGSEKGHAAVEDNSFIWTRELFQRAEERGWSIGYQNIDLLNRILNRDLFKLGQRAKKGIWGGRVLTHNELSVLASFADVPIEQLLEATHRQTSLYRIEDIHILPATWGDRWAAVFKSLSGGGDPNTPGDWLNWALTYTTADNLVGVTRKDLMWTIRHKDERVRTHGRRLMAICAERDGIKGSILKP